MSQVLMILVMAMALVVPVRAIAQDEGTPTAGMTQTTTAPEPIEDPAPAAIPTLPPPPVEAQAPPAVIEPTAPPAPVVEEPALVEMVPTMPPAPTAVPPTAVPSPTQVPPTPTPTEVVWVNTDSLSIIDPAALAPLAPGASQQLTIRYKVTTPRSATTIHAELRGATQGWAIVSPQFEDKSKDKIAAKATWIERATLTPGASFDLPIIITAPADPAANQTVELRLWSTSTTAKGSERGVKKPERATASLTVIAPEPTAVPSPTSEPTAEPTAEPTVEPDPTSEPTSGQDVESGEGDIGETPEASPEAVEDDDAGEAGDAEAEDEIGPEASPTALPEQVLSRALLDRLEPMGTVAGEYGNCGEPTTNGDWIEFHCQAVGKGPYALTFSASSGIEECSVNAADESNSSACSGTQNIGNGNQTNARIIVRFKSSSGKYSVSFTLNPNKDGPVQEFTITSPASLKPMGEDLALSCEPDSVTLNLTEAQDVACTVSGKSSLPQDVTVTKLEVTSPGGTDLSREGSSGSGQSLTIALDGAVIGQGQESDPVPFSIARTACAMDEGPVQVTAWFTYEGQDDAQKGPATSVAVTPANVSVAPTIALGGPVDFGTLTWNGESWGSETRSLDVTVSRDAGCTGTADIRMWIIDSTTGVEPTLTNVLVPDGAALTALTQIGGLTDGELAFLKVEEGFENEATVPVKLTLAPTNEAMPGEYTMTIHVKVQTGP